MKQCGIFLSIILAVTSMVGLCGAGQAAPNPAQNNPIQSLAPMLDSVMPAIVNISVQGNIPVAAGPFDDGGPQNPSVEDDTKDGAKQRKFRSIGSGVIMDPKNGYVLTNAHLLRNAEIITATLSDGRRLKAKMVGVDNDSDVAVLQIEAKDLHTLPVADSNKVRVGDFVIAIGNPFGLHQFGGTNQTATFGIVSALQRNDLNIEGVEDFIQTDAAINPGNSGGALINADGKLIGINTAIISPYGGSIGIGFAIPINMANSLMNQIIKYGSIHRGLMGIFVQQLTPELAEAFHAPSGEGALITQINPDSPAEHAGLRSGDIIKTINGTEVKSSAQVKNIIGLLRVGSQISMTIIRQGKPLVINSTVTDIKKHQEQLQARNPFLFGLALQNFTQDSPAHGLVTGVQVMGASEKSNGWRDGLRPGDVIVSANSQNVDSIKTLEEVARQSKQQLLLHVLRGSGALYVLIK